MERKSVNTYFLDLMNNNRTQLKKKQSTVIRAGLKSDKRRPDKVTDWHKERDISDGGFWVSGVFAEFH